ncbi:hypothetical protein G210_3786 [Candida maltosa Xu316]|uniref:Uncharacterized protein n=1 Tax=Candida maltosa (strain Xu316) TaxID=1245528 RepID=M3HFE9_CANMX|nr:hypothetical protein G210_3786 [Candida maltosa Xu316]
MNVQVSKVEKFPHIVKFDEIEAKVSAYVLALRIVKTKSDNMVCLHVTDFTSHPQTGGVSSFHSRDLYVPSDQILVLPFHKDSLGKFDSMVEETYGMSYNFLEKFKYSEYLEVHDKLLVLKMNLQLRRYSSYLEPYSYDHEMVEYNRLIKHDKSIVDDLFKNIEKHTAYYKLIRPLAKKLLQVDEPSALSEVTKTIPEEDQKPVPQSTTPDKDPKVVPEIKKSTVPDYDQSVVPDIEQIDTKDDDEISTPDINKEYTVKEIKKQKMNIDDLEYCVKGKIIGFNPDDWGQIAGETTDNEFVVKDVEWILADPEADGNATLNSNNTINLLVKGEETLKIIEKLQIRGTPAELRRKFGKKVLDKSGKFKLKKVTKPVGKKYKMVVWSLA